MQAEHNLGEHAQWKQIQENTFTRWANEHLKTVGSSIDSLETDLSDGLRLIQLVEVLSQKQLPSHSQHPTFRSQKMDNVSIALTFLMNEGIKIVNIGKWTGIKPYDVLLLNCNYCRLYGYSRWQSEADNGSHLDAHSALLHLDARVGRR